MALVDRVASLATRVGQELKALALSKADDSAVVHLSGTETISGTKVFGSPPQVPVGTMAYHPVRRDDARLAPSARTVTYANLPGLAPSSNVALDIVTCTLTGSPTISPATGTDGQIIRLRMLASGAQRTPAVGTSVRLGTGITDRSMVIPSGQWGVFGLEYIGGLNLWVLFSEYVVSAS